MITEEMIRAVNGKLAETKRELEAMGLECSLLWRSPGGAKDAVAYLLVGASASDVEAARKNSSAN